MRQLQLVSHGEPSQVVELKTFSKPDLGEDDVRISMEAAPINPSDFLLIRGRYGIRPTLPFGLGAEGVGRVIKTGSRIGEARGCREPISRYYVEPNRMYISGRLTPALNAINFPRPSRFRMASAMIDRAQFAVQKNSTFIGS
jgi:hypothetical protein